MLTTQCGMLTWKYKSGEEVKIFGKQDNKTLGKIFRCCNASPRLDEQIEYIQNITFVKMVIT